MKTAENVLYEEKVPAPLLFAILLVPFFIVCLVAAYDIAFTRGFSLSNFAGLIIALIISVNILLLLLNGILIKVTPKEIVITSHLGFVKRIIPLSTVKEHAELSRWFLQTRLTIGVNTALAIGFGFIFLNGWVATYTAGLGPYLLLKLTMGEQVMLSTNNPKKIAEILKAASKSTN